MNKKTWLVISCLIILGWCIYAIVVGLFGSGANRHKWGYDLGSRHMVPVMMSEVLPKTGPSGSIIVVALVFRRVESGELQIIALKTLTEEAAELHARIFADPTAITGAEFTAALSTIQRGILLRRVHEETWWSESSAEGKKIQSEIVELQNNQEWAFRPFADDE